MGEVAKSIQLLKRLGYDKWWISESDYFNPLPYSIAGDVFMLRMVGAACDAGMEIDEIVAFANLVNQHIWSIGAAITTQWTDYDTNNSVLFNRQKEHIEYGIGLHGERGIVRTKPQPVDQLVDKMYHQFISEIGSLKGTDICVLVNGLGSISLMELSIIFQHVKSRLEDDGIYIYDADVNSYCAGYSSDGFSITLYQIDEKWKQLYSSACYSPYYSHVVRKSSQKRAAKHVKPSLPLASYHLLLLASRQLAYHDTFMR